MDDTIIYNTITHGDIDQVQKLLKQGVDLNLSISRYLFNYTPLEWAIHYERKDIVLLLLDSGANVNTKSSSNITPLMVSVSYGIEIVKLLLDRGADPNVRNNNNQTALDNAFSRNEFKIVKLILNHPNFDLENGDINDLLVYAALSGSTGIVRKLLDRGADPNAEIEGKTALDLAVENGHRKIVNLLALRKGETLFPSEKELRELAATHNIQELERRLTLYTAENAIEFARSRYKGDKVIPRELLKPLVIPMEITTILTLAGVPQYGRTISEFHKHSAWGGSPDFAELLYDEDFWRLKLHYDFPDLVKLVGHELPVWSSATVFKQPWKRYYNIVRYYMRQHIYPVLLRSRTKLRQSKIISATLVPETTSMVEVVLESSGIRYDPSIYSIQDFVKEFLSGSNNVIEQAQQKTIIRDINPLLFWINTKQKQSFWGVAYIDAQQLKERQAKSIVTLQQIGPNGFEKKVGERKITIIGRCVKCGASPVGQCGSCMETLYCGRKCQRADWETHCRKCIEKIKF